MDELENRLGLLAIQYRSANGPDEIRIAISLYHDVLKQLEVAGHNLNLDPDSLLPDEDMPDWWRARRASRIEAYRLSTLKPKK